MGIQGLMTYMSQNSDIYLQNFLLHNCYLVIDGNGIASQLYTHEAKSNDCFGGDYDKYAYSVSIFFDDLLKCNVTPLVIIDGGSEDKKLSTIYKRTKDRIRVAYDMAPAKRMRAQLFPLLLKSVFNEVALKKGIKIVQSLFEADEDIASVARLLNCPVLSFDSDFYIFDVMYIPYNTLDHTVIRNPYGEGYVKNCKVYKIDHFLSRFRGMNRSVMPLAATLLGNDYINRSTFKDFFATLKLSKTSKRRYNEQQRRIEATFRWLQKQTLDTAIACVLSKINPQKRKKILEVMEMIINGYLIPSPRMLYPLGFTSDFINLTMQKMPRNPYKFQQDINNLRFIEEPKGDDESDLDCHDYENIDEDLDIVTPDKERNLCLLAPQWFIQEFNAANFPSYFIDMLTRQLYVCAVQIEDFGHPTCINISLKIIRVIFKLLNSGTSNSNTLEYVARGKMTNINTYKLNCDDSIFHCKYPSLSELRNIPILIRKEILNKVLGVTDGMLNPFPPEWQLYIATMKYWIDEAEEQFRTNVHFFSLFFAMLFHVIDRKIGFIRSQSYFDRKYGQELMMVKQMRNNSLIYPSISNKSIFDAYNLVNFEDCLLAFPFFLSNFSIDDALLMNPKKFHISTVHAFSLFQNCLRHSIHLNALLGYPYPAVNISQFFNGTLLYNLYTKFKIRNDIEDYISIILNNSPSLKQLFYSMLSEVRSAFGKALDNQINSGKKKRSKNRQRNTDFSPEEEPVEEERSDIQYNDLNNRYAVLNNFYPF